MFPQWQVMFRNTLPLPPDLTGHSMNQHLCKQELTVPERIKRAVTDVNKRANKPITMNNFELKLVKFIVWNLGLSVYESSSL